MIKLENSKKHKNMIVYSECRACCAVQCVGFINLTCLHCSENCLSLNIASIFLNFGVLVKYQSLST